MWSGKATFEHFVKNGTSRSALVLSFPDTPCRLSASSVLSISRRPSRSDARFTVHAADVHELPCYPPIISPSTSMLLPRCQFMDAICTSGQVGGDKLELGI